MKKIDTLTAMGLVLLLIAIGLSVYILLVAARPSSDERSSISTGVESIPDISSVEKDLRELDLKQKFGPVPVTVGAGETGRDQPFSNF